MLEGFTRGGGTYVRGCDTVHRRRWLNVQVLIESVLALVSCHACCTENDFGDQYATRFVHGCSPVGGHDGRAVASTEGGGWSQACGARAGPAASNAEWGGRQKGKTQLF